jgi:DNA repair protein RadA/Sms
MVEAPAETKSASGSAKVKKTSLSKPERLTEIDSRDEIRFSTGLGEFDRVLGGGAVRGSLVLVGGAPGIGKSTILLQMCATVAAGEKVLYITGEESTRQLKLRADRLGVSAENLFVLAETDITEAIAAAEELSPDIIIADSIQTLYNPDLSGSAGSVGQVKDCTMTLMQLSKNEGITTFVVGHVNKEGAIAGPKVLEHMVDCVLYFEGERSLSYRVLRSAKNRFGSTNEIGVFEMLDNGLREVENPSEMLLSGRPENSPGTCVTCVMEGTRPILAEIQALVTQSGYNVSRRNSNGFDYNRAMLLLAVLEKRGGIAVGNCDAYVNVIGGLSIDEPAADLAAVLAIASSQRDKPVGNELAAVGEVGLTGEIRSVSHINQRLAEISRLGFKRCVIPAHVRGDIKAPKGLELVPVRNIRGAVAAVLDYA